MTRATNNRAVKHRKIKKLAKGFKHSARKRIRTAKEALLHQGQYQYVGRKKKKRDFHKLWIMRINAACRERELTYKDFMHKLKEVNIELNKKMLADIAVNDPDTFDAIVDKINIDQK